MARKKKPEEHVNHERWLVSYADFITLLFAFFVVMFAVSQVDSNKVGRFTEAFSRAMGADLFPQPGRGLLPGDGPPEQPSDESTERGDSPLPNELEGLISALQQARSSDGDLEGLQVVRRRNELVLRLPDNILFESGAARVKEPAGEILRTIAGTVRARRVDIRVEGHTDDRPIRTGASRYGSNWELSTARATAVLMTLTDAGLPPPRLSAAGYGEFRPVASNDSEDGRRQNRRVDLVLTVSAPASRETPEVRTVTVPAPTPSPEPSPAPAPSHETAPAPEPSPAPSHETAPAANGETPPSNH